MKILDRLKTRRPLTAQQRSDRAEVEAFHAGVVGREVPRSRKSQLFLVLALGLTFVGAWMGVGGSGLGFALFVVGLPATVAIGWWCFRNWEY
jgi:hypothetical protein